MQKLKMSTPDLTDEKINQIETLFPGVVTESRDSNGNITKAVDFDMLRQHLSKNLVEDTDERYRLDWPGKKASLLKANTPINKTLRPCKEESVNFDKTENLYLEGDNFEILKILQESYLGQVKMIYIDPPYNTGKDFVYKDNFAQSREDYEDEIGVTDEEGGKLFKNTDNRGRFHSDWLSMMYERLIVARDLLKDDGVVFISIDDNEVHNLRKICDEIFGEGNFIANVVWQRAFSPKNDAKYLSENHDYILIYSKNFGCFDAGRLPRSKEANARYKNLDNDKRGDWISDNLTVKTYSEKYDYPIITPSGREVLPAAGRCWSMPKEKMLQLIKDDRIWFGAEGGNVPRLKRFLSEVQDGMVATTLWMHQEVGHNQEGRQEVKYLFDDKGYFDGPKPIRLLSRIINIANANENDIILDFFSGSATTAHAVMQLNAEDGGNRKFIMCQLPEETDEKTEAYKAGYKTIAEIGKERIRRAGKKIVEENADKLKDREQPLDIGFRVFKTASSNMKDVFYHPEDIKQQELDNLMDNIKEDRTAEDLLTQVLLDLGLSLDLAIEEKSISGHKVFFVQDNALAVCFDRSIDFDIVDKIAEVKPFRAVFRDSSFTDDKDRINVEERFKRLSPETRVMVI